jgi:hypothetical protein
MVEGSAKTITKLPHNIRFIFIDSFFLNSAKIAITKAKTALIKTPRTKGIDPENIATNPSYNTTVQRNNMMTTIIIRFFI